MSYNRGNYQIVTFGCANVITTGNYFIVGCMANQVAEFYVPIPFEGQITEMRIYSLLPPGAGVTDTFTIDLNDTAVIVDTLGPAETTASSSWEIDVDPGDCLTCQATSAGGVTACSEVMVTILILIEE